MRGRTTCRRGPAQDRVAGAGGEKSSSVIRSKSMMLAAPSG